MSIHLSLLALQSLRRIAARLGVEVDVPDFFFRLYGSPPTEFENALQRATLVLESLMEEYGITWGGCLSEV